MGDITRLLERWAKGDGRAFQALVPVVYEELRRLADHYLRQERGDHTLQPTALVHEAYLRLLDSEIAWEDRQHFFAVTARAMRRVLVDHARAKSRGKRGGDATFVTLDDGLALSPQTGVDLVALDDALDRLAAVDERKARAVELHFFGGLTYEETARALDVSPATIDRDLRMAKAWLLQQLR